MQVKNTAGMDYTITLPSQRPMLMPNNGVWVDVPDGYIGCDEFLRLHEKGWLQIHQLEPVVESEPEPVLPAKAELKKSRRRKKRKTLAVEAALEEKPPAEEAPVEEVPSGEPSKEK